MTTEDFTNYLKVNNIKHLIFDFDNTICHLNINWSSWQKKIENIYKHYDPTFTSQNLWERAEIQNDFIRRFGSKLRKEVVKGSFDHERNTSKGCKPCHNSIAVIKQLAGDRASGIKAISVWSSNDTRTLLPILTEMGLNKAIGKVVGRDTVTFIKPDPEGFSVINSKNYPKESYLFIGDSTSDEKAASAAGIKFLHVSSLMQ